MNHLEMEERHENWMVFTILVGGILTSLAISTINIALPELMTQFHSNLNTVKWTLTGFMLATGAVAPLTSFLGERFSFKNIYLLSIIGFTISSMACAMAPSVELLILFRILQGVFNGLSMPSSMSIIYQTLHKEKQAAAMGLWSFALTIAPAVGPTIGGGLIQLFSWQAIFWLNVPFGVISALLIWKFIPSYRLNKPEKFDSLGFIASFVSTACMLLAFSNVTQWGWTSAKTIGLLVVGAGIFFLFIRRQRRIEHPILDLSVFRSATFSVSIILRAIVMMALYAGSLLTPLFLQKAQHESAFVSGLILLPASFCMAIATLAIGRVYNRVNPVHMIRTGIVGLGLGSLLLSFSTLNSSHLFIIGSLIFRNVGIALASVTITMYGMGSLDRNIAGNGSAINNWVSQSIGCFAIGFFSSILSGRSDRLLSINFAGQSGSALDYLKDTMYVQAINFVYLLSALIVLIAFGVSFFYRKKSSEPGLVGQTVQ